jgi:Trp operon repressor
MRLSGRQSEGILQSLGGRCEPRDSEVAAGEWEMKLTNKDRKAKLVAIIDEMLEERRQLRQDLGEGNYEAAKVYNGKNLLEAAEVRLQKWLEKLVGLI